MAEQENKKLIRRHIDEMWNAHNIEKLDEFISSELLDEATDHTQQFLTAFPDLRVTVEDMIAEGDKVFVRLHVAGTNSGPFAGQPPTGKKIQMDSFRVFRIGDGKIVQSWAMQDRLGLMEQLGLLKSSGGVNWAAGEED